MLDKIRLINWKTIGLFCLKLVLYLLVIPITAYVLQFIAFSFVAQYFFKIKNITGGTAIGLRIWSMVAIVIYTFFFYVYVLSNRYVKSIRRRKIMLFLFIFIPGFLVGAQFSLVTNWSIIGNLLYSSSFYVMYYILEFFLPSFRDR